MATAKSSGSIARYAPTKRNGSRVANKATQTSRLRPNPLLVFVIMALPSLKRKWTAAEDEAIRQHATKISLARLAVRLKRTSNAVSTRASELQVELKRRLRM
jgi:hypothetical protein